MRTFPDREWTKAVPQDSGHPDDELKRADYDSMIEMEEEIAPAYDYMRRSMEMLCNVEQVKD